MLRPTHITFDCYGTLIDWESGIKQALSEVLGPRAAQLRVDLDTLHDAWEAVQFSLIQEQYLPYKEVLQESFRRLFRLLDLPVQAEDARRFASSMYTWQPFPDTALALRRMRSISKLVILSNTDEDIIARSVAHIGEPFDQIITAERLRIYKPSPQVFQRALEILGCSPAQLLHVAFGFKYDITPASALGIRTVWVNRKREPLRVTVRPDHEVTDLHGVSDLLVGGAR